MDESGRKITKIAREAGKFTLKMMKEEGIGTAEFDFIHFIRVRFPVKISFAL